MKLKICKKSDVSEGRPVAKKILARRVAVFLIEGEYYAIEGDCKHQKAPLDSGKCEGRVVECGWHGWRYDIPSGECLTEKWAKLRTYPVAVEDDWLVVDLSG
ncbi:MAG: Rieske 2Fe-2S domain-containing protein [candidate division Zixibacteria bacterium]|nr:Rieske 2Fe-2S domain-containing protein [candidate division Zixibacteria bacterium]